MTLCCHLQVFFIILDKTFRLYTRLLNYLGRVIAKRPQGLSTFEILTA